MSWAIFEPELRRVAYRLVIVSFTTTKLHRFLLRATLTKFSASNVVPLFRLWFRCTHETILTLSVVVFNYILLTHYRISQELFLIFLVQNILSIFFFISFFLNCIHTEVQPSSDFYRFRMAFHRLLIVFKWFILFFNGFL